MVTNRGEESKLGPPYIPLPVDLDGIPVELCSLPQFGVWRFEQFTDDDGQTGWAKIPINAQTGRRASSTNSATWCSFDLAARAYKRGGFAGLAYFLRAGSGIVGLDFDKCRDRTTGAVEPWAARKVNLLQSYTELSPSDRGLRLFVFGKLPPRDRREGRFECYESSRFLSLTGNRLAGAPATIEHRQAELIAVHTEVFAARVARRNAVSPARASGYTPHHLSDLALLDVARQAKNGGKFRALYDAGDISGYASPSEADAALCGMLAFYVGPDAGRIDELFRGSALLRSKWDRCAYRDSTIRLALEGKSEFYKPPCVSRHQRRRGHGSIAFRMEVS
jgi:primase-polymerase (primpol)-like protein